MRKKAPLTGDLGLQPCTDYTVPSYRVWYSSPRLLDWAQDSRAPRTAIRGALFYLPKILHEDLDKSYGTSMLSSMSEDTERRVGIVVTFPAATHEKLRDLAKANKRSLTRHAEWVLERYIATQEDDAA